MTKEELELIKQRTNDGFTTFPEVRTLIAEVEYLTRALEQAKELVMCKDGWVYGWTGDGHRDSEVPDLSKWLQENQ